MDIPVTGITRATTAPRILEWIRRYLVIPVAGVVRANWKLYDPLVSVLDRDNPIPSQLTHSMAVMRRTGGFNGQYVVVTYTVMANISLNCVLLDLSMHCVLSSSVGPSAWRRYERANRKDETRARTRESEGCVS